MKAKVFVSVTLIDDLWDPLRSERLAAVPEFQFSIQLPPHRLLTDDGYRVFQEKLTDFLKANGIEKT